MSEKSRNQLTRRQMLKSLALTSGAFLAACTPSTPPPPVKVEVTKVVEKAVEVTKVVEKPVEKVITSVPTPKGVVTIRATTNMNIKIWESLISGKFKDQFPNIKIELSQTPVGTGWDTYADAIITRIAGGDVLDAVAIATEGLGLMTEKKIFIPLDNFVAADSAFKADLEKDFHPNLVKAHMWKGKLMQIPFEWNSGILMYNTKIFADKGIGAPKKDWNWDDFLDICKKVANVKGTKDDVYAYSFTDNTFAIASWYFNNGTSWLKNENTESNMEDPKVTEVLNFLVSLVREHKVAPDPAGWDPGGQFTSGHQAIRFGFRNTLSSAVAAKFEDFALTMFPNKGGQYRTALGCGGWAVTTMSRNPDEAWQAIKLLTGPEAAIQELIIQGASTSRKSAMNSKEYWPFPASADKNVIIGALDYASIMPVSINFNVVDPLMRRWYANLWNGKLTVKEVVAGIQKELTAEMAKIKK